jgi:hypothetical protein
MKQLVIAVGPQGSGNHLYAKIFGSNENVFAWETLQHKYWEGHDMEPFSDCWENPELLLDFDTTTHDYYYTSMGAPYVFDGETKIPDFKNFHHYATQAFHNVTYMIIGRDRNILEHQQTRVRGRHTTPRFLEQLDFFMDKKHIFVSQELLYLYGAKYVNSIEEQLDIPKNTNTRAIEKILVQDKNKKYMNYVEYTELDDLIKLASSKRGAL